MDNFWTGGAKALYRGAKAEYKVRRAELKRRLEAAADEEERLGLEVELECLKESYAHLLDGDARLLF